MKQAKLIFEEQPDPFVHEPLWRLWRAEGYGHIWYIMYNGEEYAANIREKEDDVEVLMGGPWDTFEEAEASCRNLVPKSN
jgi:hypothetical protein